MVSTNAPEVVVVSRKDNAMTSDHVVFNFAMNNIDDDSPWDADPSPSHTHQSEWSKIASEFTNVRNNRDNSTDT